MAILLLTEEFYGREQELLNLKSLLQKEKSSLVLVKGRRRIGKSSLIKKFATRNKIQIYEDNSCHFQIKKIQNGKHVKSASLYIITNLMACQGSLYEDRLKSIDLHAQAAC